MRNFCFLFIAVFAASLCAGNAAAAGEEPLVECFLKVPAGEVVTWVGDQSGIEGVNDWGDETYANSFTSDNEAFVFNNSYSLSQYGNYWSGFGYTNASDVTTASPANVSAITGSGVSNDPEMAYITAYVGITPVITFAENASFERLGMYVTNATYPYLSMKNGDDYAKKFGGVSGTDPDWFKITATGYAQGGGETGSAEFYLADFRSGNSLEDYILKEWGWFDLSSLGAVASVAFSLSSSDSGEYGMNTPAYFCIDGLKGAKSSISVENTGITDATNIYYAAGSLYIQGLTGAEVRIYDITGSAVAAFIAGGDYEPVPLNLNKGVYVVQVIKDGKPVVRKISVH